MTKSASLGFPRIGAFRELKKAVEGYWKVPKTPKPLYFEHFVILQFNLIIQLEFKHITLLKFLK